MAIWTGDKRKAASLTLATIPAKSLLAAATMPIGTVVKGSINGLSGLIGNIAQLRGQRDYVRLETQKMQMTYNLEVENLKQSGRAHDQRIAVERERIAMQYEAMNRHDAFRALELRLADRANERDHNRRMVLLERVLILVEDEFTDRDHSIAKSMLAQRNLINDHVRTASALRDALTQAIGFATQRRLPVERAQIGHFMVATLGEDLVHHGRNGLPYYEHAVRSTIEQSKASLTAFSALLELE